MSENKKRAIVLVAEGSEEMETVICVDVLRRAGVDVVLAGVGGGGPHVTASRGVRLIPDAPWNPADLAGADALVLPGGLGGTNVFRADESVKQAVRDALASGKMVGAMCAAPYVLHDAGVLAGRRYTSYPSCAPDLTDGAWVDEPDVRDGNLITGQGPATAFDFALALARALVGDAVANQVAADMCMPA